MTRKTVITEEVISKLLEAFSMGYKVNHACLYAEICKQTFYNYCNKTEGFLEHCHELRQHPSIKAIALINKAINEGDVNSAKWWLERKCKEEFSLRQEITGEDGEAIKMKVPEITVVFTNKKDE
jgi:hypothetical protein